MTSFTTGYMPVFDLDFLDTYKNDDDDKLVLYCTENDDGTCHFVIGKREEKDDDHVSDSEVNGRDEDEGDYGYDNEDGLQEVEGDKKEEEEEEEEEQQQQLKEEEDVEEEEEEEEEEAYQFHIALGDEPAPGNDEEILLNFTNINGSDVHMRFLLYVPPEDTEAYTTLATRQSLIVSWIVSIVRLKTRSTPTTGGSPTTTTTTTTTPTTMMKPKMKMTVTIVTMGMTIEIMRTSMGERFVAIDDAR